MPLAVRRQADNLGLYVTFLMRLQNLNTLEELLYSVGLAENENERNDYQEKDPVTLDLCNFRPCTDKNFLLNAIHQPRTVSSTFENEDESSFHNDLPVKIYPIIEFVVKAQSPPMCSTVLNTL